MNGSNLAWIVVARPTDRPTDRPTHRPTDRLTHQPIDPPTNPPTTNLPNAGRRTIDSTTHWSICLLDAAYRQFISLCSFIWDRMINRARGSTDQESNVRIVFLPNISNWSDSIGDLRLVVFHRNNNYDNTRVLGFMKSLKLYPLEISSNNLHERAHNSHEPIFHTNP